MVKQPVQLKFNVVFFFLALGGMLHFHTASAQSYRYVRTYTEQHGLSDNRVTCFYKDVHGYVWIGTRNGLNRYDGHSFKVYKPTSKQSISNEIINDITGDSAGNIWVATMNGLNRLDHATGKWTTWMPDNQNKQNTLPNNLVWDIELDKNGKLWIASDVFSFASLDYTKNQFDLYDWPGFVKTISGIRTPKGYHSILRFVQSNSDTCWLGTNKGLVMLNIRTKQFTYLGAAYNDQLSDMQYDSIRRKVLLVTEEGSLWEYGLDSGTFNVHQPESEPYPSTHFNALETHEHWLASAGGIIRYGNRTPVRMHHVPGLDFSIPPGGVHRVYTDDQKMIWIGTPNGFSLIDSRDQSLRFVPLTPASDKDGVNRMTSVWYDDATEFYFVTCRNPAGVFMIDKKTGRIQPIQTDASGKRLPECNLIKKVAGDIWLLTSSAVYRYHTTSGTFKPFPTPFDISGVQFTDVLQDASGNIWFSTFGEGVFYYDARDKAFKRIITSTDTFLLRGATALERDISGQWMWVATYGSDLYRYHVQNNSMEVFSESLKHTLYKPLNLVNDLETDHQGNMWAATHAGGVFTYSERLKFFQPFDMMNGYRYNEYLALKKGKGNMLYLLSRKGVSYIDITKPQTEQVIPYLSAFSSFGSFAEVPHRMFYDVQENELIVPVAGGLLFYNHEPQYPIEGFKIVADEVFAESGTIEMKDEGYFQLSLDHKRLSIHFAGLYYGATPVLYQYKMEGLDKDWIQANPLLIAEYQNLPKGHYSFQIRATDVNGVEMARSEPVVFYVQPPFYDTWWFKLLVAVCVLWIVWRVIHHLQNRIRDERILNQFATSLYGKNSVEDIFWDVASNCVKWLGYPDCVVYQHDEKRKVLVQRSAAGPKNPKQVREIFNQIELPLGVGVVGSVGATGKAERISNTFKDKRYVVDDAIRLSEITVPIKIDGKVFGVIDSEHPQKNYYKRRDMRMLKKIAAICAERISKFMTEERLRSKIARDLHDEMGSVLTSINILSKVAMTKTNDIQTMESYLDKIKSHSSDMMENMSDIVWAINPSNDSIDKLLSRMKEFAAELLEPAGIKANFITTEITDTTLLNLEERKDLYLIFKEALHNAVKYSRATQIDIELLVSEQEIILRVTDNGVGFRMNPSFSGNGLRNMQTRADEISATLRIVPANGKGTMVELMKRITS
ncbi:MAG TPA: two-component regulator propeller domain-containing protein [Ferruginibacter sp.]|nr:two-component regulator propeller domain-containing protein [Ferruginibacter sp.]HRO17226.1 two-component regulator propeller domain-containing protein [Ferruginibacter sp.]HRQ20408.1 two-component regulator propeller domain-containing protein [Ferruginibacter sp.]